MYLEHGGSERKKLKKLPTVSYSPNSKSCHERGCYGIIYTARIRIRAGGKDYIRTSKYSKDTFETKKQLQFIVGTYCTSCGIFTEDEAFKKLRQRQQK